MSQNPISALPRRRLPQLLRLGPMLGPGLVWMALAQGSGELIWWPYLIAKYGLTFLFLLIPACLLQYPLNVELGRYTLLTGESIFRGFFRLHRGLGILLWVLMTLSFLWFGAFAAAGGTALAALTDFPYGWSARGQSVFWGYISIAVYALAVAFSGVVYRFVERFMQTVAIVTIVGLLWACADPQVLTSLPEFARALLGPIDPMPRVWDPDDAGKLLTAISFAGLGGFWLLFYSYWLRDKGAGMASHMGRITGPIVGKPETICTDGFLPEDSQENEHNWRRWRRYLALDSGIGVAGNLLTTLMTCLLAYALLFPQGLLPQDYELAVVQSRFFEAGWGELGRILFLIVAAAFLTDTWLATADGVSRMHADVVQIMFPRAKAWSQRYWYYLFFAVLTAITSLTMLLDAPAALIVLSALIGFVGTVIFPAALYLLNHRVLDAQLPAWARPGRGAAVALLLAFIAYGALAVAYFVLR